METKNNKPGLLKTAKLERHSGNFQPKISYNIENDTKTEKNSNTIINEDSISKKKLGQNQTASIKLPQSTKNELYSLRLLTNTKFDYEIIQTLIDVYKNQLSAAEIKKLRLINELQLE